VVNAADDYTGPYSIFRGGSGQSIIQAQSRTPVQNKAPAQIHPDASPAFLADPDTYRLVFEDQYFRVLSVTWKAGTTDQPHTHPLPGVRYSLNDCQLRIHEAGGVIREVTNTHGSVGPVQVVTQPHRAENPGSTDCNAIIVERK
jgi:hypothetical protein